MNTAITVRDRLKIFEDAIKSMELTSLQARHFDIAKNAVNDDELDFVIKNTDHRTIQDYAIFKANFWAAKKRGEL